jgi:hypothetical protein
LSIFSLHECFMCCQRCRACKYSFHTYNHAFIMLRV